MKRHECNDNAATIPNSKDKTAARTEAARLSMSANRKKMSDSELLLYRAR